MHVSGIGIGIVSMFVLAFMVSQLGNFHAYWVLRSREWVQATTFLNSENCRNPLIKSSLGTFNLCETSEQICSRFPLTSAIHDVAQDLNVCGHDRCTVFYMDITANLHKIVIGSAVLSVIGMYVFKRCCDDNKIEQQIRYYQLPSHMKRN